MNRKISSCLLTIFAIFFLLTACNRQSAELSQEDTRSTAVIQITSESVQLPTMVTAVNTVTVVPTATQRPTATPPPMFTATPTITPLPVDDSATSALTEIPNDKSVDYLVFSRILAENVDDNGLYAVLPDGTGLRQILNYAALSELFGKQVSNAYYWGAGNRRFVEQGTTFYEIGPNWQVLHLFDYGQKVGGRFFSPDGSQLLLASKTGELSIISFDENVSEVQLIDSIQFNHDAFWSPDQRNVYIETSKEQEKIVEDWVFKVTGGAPTKLRDVIHGYAVSPDREQVIYGWNNEIRLTTSADVLLEQGKVVATVGDGATIISRIQWSPRGDRLIISRLRCQSTCVYIGPVLIDTSNWKIVKEFDTDQAQYGNDTTYCGFSPDGSSLVFRSSSPEGWTSLQLVFLDEDVIVDLAKFKGGINCPLWLPKGTDLPH